MAIIVRSFFNPSSCWYYPLRWLVLVILGWAIYAQTFGFGFVFDDFNFIVNNPYIKRFDHIHYIWKTYPPTRAIGFYSFAFNYFINQSHPQGYHIFNFIIHLLATGLVWALALVLFKIAGGASSKREAQELPYLIAVIFLVHPCQTQAVTYISQRFESMATLFYLGSIYSYLCGRMASSGRRQIFLFICCVGFAILGLFTKEVAATIPLMVLAVEFIFFNGYPLNSQKSPAWKFYLLIAVLGVVFALLFMKLVRDDFFNAYFHFFASSESHDGDIITGSSYVLTQMRVFLTFLRLLILPINQNLDYDYPVSTGLFSPPLTLAGLGVIIFITFLIFKLRKQWPLIAFGLAWILITFSINTAPRVNLIFEHKLYLISFGFFLSAVCTLSIIIKDRKILFGLLIMLIAILSLASYKRNQVWKNDLTLWGDVVLKSPHKARAYNSLGVFYGKDGDFVQALIDFNKAIAINPYYAEGYNNRGNVYANQGNFTQAMSDFNKAIGIRPNYFEAYLSRGLAYYNQGKLSQAMSDYNKAIEINPDSAEAVNNRGIVYYSEGNLTKAISAYDRAIEINPDYAEAYFNRGNIYNEQGDLEGALSNFNKTIEISPDFTGAFYNRGLLFAKQGKNTQAISDFSKVIEIDPGNAEVYVDRGLLFVQQSGFVQAVSDYNKAIEINPNDAEAYNRRGFIYDCQGRLTQAMSDYNKAIEINPHYAQAYYNRAVSYYHLKEYDRAWKDVHKVESLGININPGFLGDLKNIRP